jgi:hypothetical protein
MVVAPCCWGDSTLWRLFGECKVIGLERGDRGLFWSTCHCFCKKYSILVCYLTMLKQLQSFNPWMIRGWLCKFRLPVSSSSPFILSFSRIRLVRLLELHHSVQNLSIFVWSASSSLNFWRRPLRFLFSQSALTHSFQVVEPVRFVFSCSSYDVRCT